MKSCPSCGAQNEDTAGICQSCGAALDDAGRNPQYDAAGTAADPAAGDNPGLLWLWLNGAMVLVSLLFCCISFLGVFVCLAAIVGVVFGALSVSASTGGRRQEALSQARVSKILFIAAAVGGAASVVLTLLFGVLLLGTSLLGIFSSLPGVID